MKQILTDFLPVGKAKTYPVLWYTTLMMAKWTPEIEQRYTELRLRQLSSSLTPAEATELSKIRAMVAVVEAETTAPALQKLEAEQAMLQDKLTSLQAENSELVQLLNQQALLIANTK